MKDEGRPEGCACGRPSAPVTAFSPCCFHPSSFILHPSDSSFILHPSSFARRGVTLIELLVVAVIILMMLALAARQMKLSLDSRRAREAARAINVYLSSARNQAIATRRPCGVALMPMMNIVASTTSTTTVAPCVATLQQLEVPAPYSGDDSSAVLQVTSLGGGLCQASTSSGTAVSPGLVHIGDKIQFNNQGPWFLITSTGSNGIPPYNLSPVVQTPGQIVPWLSSGTASFQINRMPNLHGLYDLGLSGTAASTFVGTDVAPLQLPAGSVIDLSGSWFGDYGNFIVNTSLSTTAYAFPSGTIVDPNNPTPAPKTSPPGPPIYVGLYIMFSPSGAVDSLYCAFYATSAGTLSCYSSQSLPISQPIYLLVGRPDYARNLGPKVTLTSATGATIQATMQNWLDPSNIWIVVNPQTGVVTTAPVAALDPVSTLPSGTVNPISGAQFPNKIVDSSQSEGSQRATWIGYSCMFARQGQALGGK